MSMMNGLYVIAGSSGAIGRKLCGTILQRGGTPLLVGRSAEKLQAVNDEFNSKCRIIADIDFSKPAEAGKKLTAELKGESSIQGLAYAVGSITLKPLRGCTEADFIESYNVNVLGAVELIKASLAGLKKAGAKGDNPASIVLFSSVAAANGLNNHSVIACSKAAVEGLTKSLAAELSPAIRVNCVAPSLTDQSAMSSSMTSNEKMAEAIAKSHPLPRLGQPADSAAAAAYLLSSDSSWTTGIVLPVDGGRSTILK
jgi:NAD(P)-dependent dehydrogenase (short-subunit alcohol dehydrogenase family)